MNLSSHPHAMVIEQKAVRLNGCACPLHYQQIGSYLLWLFYSYYFYFIEFIALKPLPKTKYIFLIIYSLLLVAILIITFISTIIDPTDFTVHYEKALIRLGYLYFYL